MASVCRFLRRRPTLLTRQQWLHSAPACERNRDGVSQSRAISSGSPLAGDLPLLNSLRHQVEHENKVRSLQDVLSPPEPFKLVETPNAQEVVLHRTFGVEDIEITCVHYDQTYGDNDGEEGFDPPPNVPMKMVQMTIKISVGSDQPFLEIVCCTFGDRASIEQVLVRNRVVKLKEAPYEGPDISLLSDKIKLGFVRYLEARGIDNELGKFLLKYVPQKDQQKNACWLAKVEGFVKV